VVVLVVAVDSVETLDPACTWAVVEVTPTGEVVLDVPPEDDPSARAAALKRVIPRISPATMATSRTNLLMHRGVLSCIRCSS
jgi:hypothetical protein